MIDAAGDPQAALAAAASAGLTVSAIALYTDNGGGGVHVATAADVAAAHAAGLPVLAVFNGAYVNGGSTGTAQQGQADGAEAVKEAAALGLPQGCVLAIDIEEDALAALEGAYLVEVAKAVQAGGWVCMFYVSARQAAFNAVIDAALSQDQATIVACLWWLPSWLGTGQPVGPPPQWSDPLGPADLPWSSQYIANVAAWQWWNEGTFDVSIYRAPLPAQLWGPPAQPPATQPSTLAAQVAALEEQLAAAQADNATLHQQVAALQAKIAAAQVALG